MLGMQPEQGRREGGPGVRSSDDGHDAGEGILGHGLEQVGLVLCRNAQAVQGRLPDAGFGASATVQQQGQNLGSILIGSCSRKRHSEAAPPWTQPNDKLVK